MEAVLAWSVATAHAFYHGFPLPEPNAQVVSIEWVVETAMRLMDEADTTGDEARFGEVPHWAHLLKATQDAEGRWPLRVEVFTGQPVGEARTTAPARLFRRLGRTLRSSEFDAAAALAESGEAIR